MLLYDFIRICLILYVMASPFLMIIFQQSFFRKSFDDELGNTLIIRLQGMSVFGCLGFFLMTLDWGQKLLTK